MKKIFRKFYYSRVVWTIRFLINDLFNKKVIPQYGLTRWELCVSDIYFIWTSRTHPILSDKKWQSELEYSSMRDKQFSEPY